MPQSKRVWKTIEFRLGPAFDRPVIPASFPPNPNWAGTWVLHSLERRGTKVVLKYEKTA